MFSHHFPVGLQFSLSPDKMNQRLAQTFPFVPSRYTIPPQTLIGLCPEIITIYSESTQSSQERVRSKRQTENQCLLKRENRRSPVITPNLIFFGPPSVLLSSSRCSINSLLSFPVALFFLPKSKTLLFSKSRSPAFSHSSVCRHVDNSLLIFYSRKPVPPAPKMWFYFQSPLS